MIGKPLYTLQLYKLLVSLKVDTMELIDKMGRFRILVSGCAMFLKFTLGELLIIKYPASSIDPKNLKSIVYPHK